MCRWSFAEVESCFVEKKRLSEGELLPEGEYYKAWNQQGITMMQGIQTQGLNTCC